MRFESIYIPNEKFGEVFYNRWSVTCWGLAASAVNSINAGKTNPWPVLAGCIISTSTIVLSSGIWTVLLVQTLVDSKSETSNHPH